MEKSKFFISGIILIIIFLSIIQVVVSNGLSTSGVILGKLQNEINLYERENTVLKEKFLTVSSLTNVASQAAELGFIEEKTYVLLSAPLPLAVKP